MSAPIGTVETGLKRAASKTMGEPVEAFIHRHRAEGRSWRQIATWIREATNGAVDVSPPTIANWVK